MLNRILELHNKTIITFAGFLLSVAGWFIWMCALAGIKGRTLGPFIVRDAFLDNFGRKLKWWTTILLELVALIVIELVVQSIRRVYFPTDQDLMQRIEQDHDVQDIFKDNANTAEKGEVENSNIVEARGRQELAVPRQPDAQERSMSPQTPRASMQEQRNQSRDYRRRRLTSPTEEMEDPMDGVGRAY